MSEHRIILIRHAPVAGNAEKRYTGRGTDARISDEGYEALKRIDKAGFPYCDRVFSSPMKRGIDTAAFLFPDRKIEVIDELTEMDFGSYEGKNYNDLKDDTYYQKWIDSGGRIAFPDGEDMAGFTDRSMRAFTEILQRLTDAQSAVVICHGGNIMSILSSITGGEYFDYNADNLEGYVLDIEYDGSKPVVISYHRFCAWMDT